MYYRNGYTSGGVMTTYRPLQQVTTAALIIAAVHFLTFTFSN